MAHVRISHKISPLQNGSSVITVDLQFRGFFASNEDVVFFDTESSIVEYNMGGQRYAFQHQRVGYVRKVVCRAGSGFETRISGMYSTCVGIIRNGGVVSFLPLMVVFIFVLLWVILRPWFFIWAPHGYYWDGTIVFSSS